MDLTIVGCSGSFAGPESPASSYLVRAEDGGRTWSIVLDLGNGALGPLQRHIRPADVDAVIVSHLHVDHCIDLTSLYVLLKYDPAGPGAARMPVWGPAGAAEHLVRAYGDTDPETIAGILDVHELADRVPVTVGPFTITPYEVLHPVTAYGFRVEAGGRVLAYTGDTDTCEALSPLLAGADLVLADSAFVDGRDEPRGVHLTGSRAAQAAVEAGGVGRLMLTHIPAWNDPLVCRAQAAEVWPGVVEMAEPDRTYAVERAPVPQ